MAILEKKLTALKTKIFLVYGYEDNSQIGRRQDLPDFIVATDITEDVRSVCSTL